MEGDLANPIVKSISGESTTSIERGAFHGFLGATELGLLIKLILVESECVHTTEDDLRLIEDILFSYRSLGC